MDVVRLHQAGITYALATLGTATTQEHLNKIFRLTSELVFCFDGDRAGLQAAWRALENALPLARDGRELKFMFLPTGHDPDTLVAAEGARGFEERLEARCPAVRIPGAAADRSRWISSTWTAARSSPRWPRRCSQRMPEGVYRELLLDRLAAEIRMPAAKLKEHLGAAGRESRAAGAAGRARRAASSRTGGTNRPKRSRMSAGRGNLLSQAIALVLHHPAAARSVIALAELAGVDLPGIRRAQRAARAGRRHDPTQHRHAARALARSPRISAAWPSWPPAAAWWKTTAGAAQELQMAVQKLVESIGPGRRMRRIVAKSRGNGLELRRKGGIKLSSEGQGRPGGARRAARAASPWRATEGSLLVATE